MNRVACGVVIGAVIVLLFFNLTINIKIMKKEKLYFKNEYSEVCHPLNIHIVIAKEEGLQEIELIEAVPDVEFKNEFVWCSLVESTVDKSECKKSCCTDYEMPEKGRICHHRGKLMGFGNLIKFNVETSLPILQ